MINFGYYLNKKYNNMDRETDIKQQLADASDLEVQTNAAQTRKETGWMDRLNTADVGYKNALTRSQLRQDDPLSPFEQALYANLFGGGGNPVDRFRLGGMDGDNYGLGYGFANSDSNVMKGWDSRNRYSSGGLLRSALDRAMLRR